MSATINDARETGSRFAEARARSIVEVLEALGAQGRRGRFSCPVCGTERTKDGRAPLHVLPGERCICNACPGTPARGTLELVRDARGIDEDAAVTWIMGSPARLTPRAPAVPLAGKVDVAAVWDALTSPGLQGASLDAVRAWAVDVRGWRDEDARRLDALVQARRLAVLTPASRVALRTVRGGADVASFLDSKGWAVLAPLYDAKGRVRSLEARPSTPEAVVACKAAGNKGGQLPGWMTGELRPALLGSPAAAEELLAKGADLWLAEGMPDALALQALGLSSGAAVLAAPGADVLPGLAEALAERCCSAASRAGRRLRVFLFVQADDKGRARMATARAHFVAAGAAVVDVAVPCVGEADKDVADLVRASGLGAVLEAYRAAGTVLPLRLEDSAGPVREAVAAAVRDALAKPSAVPVLAITVGAGKTHQALREAGRLAAAGHPVFVAFPNHKLAAEGFAELDRAGIPAEHVLGQAQSCKVFRDLCEGASPEERRALERSLSRAWCRGCPFASECAGAVAVQMKAGVVQVGVHASAPGLRWPKGSKPILIIDEIPCGCAVSEVRRAALDTLRAGALMAHTWRETNRPVGDLALGLGLEAERLTRLARAGELTDGKPPRDEVRLWGQGLWDRLDVADLAEEARAHLDAAKIQAEEAKKRIAEIQAELGKTPEGLQLGGLRRALKRAKSLDNDRQAEGLKAQIGTLEEKLEKMPEGKRLKILRGRLAGLAPSVNPQQARDGHGPKYPDARAWRLCLAVADLAGGGGADGPHLELVIPLAGEPTWEICDPVKLPQGLAVVGLDATATESGVDWQIVAAPRTVDVRPLAVEGALMADAVWVATTAQRTSHLFSRGRAGVAWDGRAGGGLANAAGALVEAVEWWTPGARLGRPPVLGVIGHKPVGADLQTALQAEDAAGFVSDRFLELARRVCDVSADLVSWYGLADKGSNSFKDVDVLAVLGAPKPNLGACRRDARAGGADVSGEALMGARTRAGLIQVLGRVRHIRRTASDPVLIVYLGDVEPPGADVLPGLRWRHRVAVQGAHAPTPASLDALAFVREVARLQGALVPAALARAGIPRATADRLAERVAAELGWPKRWIKVEDRPRAVWAATDAAGLKAFEVDACPAVQCAVPAHGIEQEEAAPNMQGTPFHEWERVENQALTPPGVVEVLDVAASGLVFDLAERQAARLERGEVRKALVDMAGSRVTFEWDRELTRIAFGMDDWLEAERLALARVLARAGVAAHELAVVGYNQAAAALRALWAAGPPGDVQGRATLQDRMAKLIDAQEDAREVALTTAPPAEAEEAAVRVAEGALRSAVAAMDAADRRSRVGLPPSGPSWGELEFDWQRADWALAAAKLELEAAHLPPAAAARLREHGARLEVGRRQWLNNRRAAGV